MADNKDLDPALVAAVRKQIMDQMQSEKEVEHQRLIAKREAEMKAHNEYVAKMKESTEPWVEVLGTVQTAEGIRIELDWNDAFVAYLKSEGVTGIDDDQIIQQYVTILLRDMTERMQEEAPESSDYS